MRISRAKTPYTNNRPTFKTRKRPGVYLIYVNGVLSYVGYSTYDVYKTMYRHFQSWADKTQQRVVYLPNDARVKVRVVYTKNAKQAADLERALIIKYEPTDNPQKLLNYQTTPEENKAHETFESIPTYSGPDPF